MSKRNSKSQLREWILAVFWAFLIALFIRVFVLEVSVIPSTSMKGTIVEGDYIVLTKFNYGARLPITPFAIPFCHKAIPYFGGKPYSEKYTSKYRRLPGISSVNHNDIVVFNFPKEKGFADRKEYFVKRCIGLPGDTLRMINTKVLTNGEILSEPAQIQFNFNILSPDERLGKEWMQKWNLNEGGRKNTTGLYQFVMSPNIADSIQKEPFIKHIEKVTFDKGIIVNSESIYPYDVENFPWNIDNIGPLYIPQKGDSLEINERNLPLYKTIIEKFEKHTVTAINDSIFVDSIYCKKYPVEMDYYYVLGDNRHMSADSRFWGFVPEDHLIGKASFLAFSVKPGLKWYHKGAIRWDRFLKKL